MEFARPATCARGYLHPGLIIRLASCKAEAWVSMAIEPRSNRLRKNSRLSPEVSGHDFGRAISAAISRWALQAAEKLIAMQIPKRFVTGHDFSQADKANKTTWASAPAELVLQIPAASPSFSVACLAPAGWLPGSSDEDGPFPQPPHARNVNECNAASPALRREIPRCKQRRSQRAQ
jgi:hypothetical protein